MLLLLLLLLLFCCCCCVVVVVVVVLLLLLSLRLLLWMWLLLFLFIIFRARKEGGREGGKERGAGSAVQVAEGGGGAQWPSPALRGNKQTNRKEKMIFSKEMDSKIQTYTQSMRLSCTGPAPDFPTAAPVGGRSGNRFVRCRN